MEDSWQCEVCLHLCGLEREWRTGVAKGGKLRGILGDGVWWCYWPTLMVLVWAAEFGGCLPSLWYNGSRWRSARRLRSARTQLLHLFPEIMTRLHVYFVVSRFMLTSRLWIGCFLKNCDDVFMGRLSRLLSWPAMAKLYHKKPFRWGVWGCGTGGNCSVHLNEIKSLSRFKVKRSDFILAWTHLYILNVSMLMLN